MSVEESLEKLVLEYAEGVPDARPLDSGLLLKEDLAIESLSLVSLTIRLGHEMGLDVAELGLEFGELRTFGDLIRVAHKLEGLVSPSTTQREQP